MNVFVCVCSVFSAMVAMNARKKKNKKHCGRKKGEEERYVKILFNGFLIIFYVRVVGNDAVVVVAFGLYSLLLQL